ncbi:MAG: DUF1190 domain-containing protein [Alphaproteobacteria bacterium]|nr:DUF1190 domain-containing protein [Alphaproteobacteria bacterium]
MTAKPHAFAKFALIGLTAAATMALAGCGGDSGAKVGNGPKGVFISTQDCGGAPKFEIDHCANAIRAAIQVHNNDAPTYDSERVCEAKERSCERTLNDLYRPRLLGFYVELPEEGVPNGEPTAKPLYAAVKGEKGFRAIDGKVYLEADLTLDFSRNAVAAYKAHSGGAPKGSFGG